MSPLLLLNSPYIISIKCDTKERYFKVLHDLAPVLKVISILFLLASPFLKWYPIIASVILWGTSILINFIKWKYVFNDSFILDKDTITIKREYGTKKNTIIATIPIDGIVKLSIINEPVDEATKCLYVCENCSILPLILKIITENGIYIINCDKYFYAVLNKQIDEKRGKQ